jgi:enoyl-[acyl-carrier protein] reductase / trans-2-enoyl-CoA reductase (NAD+)
MTQAIVQQKSRGFISVNAHPEGCRKNVECQFEAIAAGVEIARAAGQLPRNVEASRTGKLAGPRNVLVVGASTGYGLASRIAAARAFGASTLGVFLERIPDRGRTGSAGHYNTVAFHEIARREGSYAVSINGDAYSNEIKKKAMEILRRHMAPVDLVVYSVASPKRTDPGTGITYSSVLKPIGNPYSSRTIELDSELVTEVTIGPATADEIQHTIAVMGGADWKLWIDALLEQNLLALGARTLAYSYVGPDLTRPIYRDGTIGQAKKDLELTARHLDQLLQLKLGGHAWVAINKAIVTQAAAAIPVVPLYMSILRKVMSEKRIEEGAIEQMRRLFLDHLAAHPSPRLDDASRIRMDNFEMQPDVQQAVMEIWPKVRTENLSALTDFAGYKREFRNLFGFDVPSVDYAQPVEIDLQLPEA